MKTKKVNLEWKEFKALVEERLESKEYMVDESYLTYFSIAIGELYVLYLNILKMNREHESNAWYKRNKLMYSFGRKAVKQAIDEIRIRRSRDLCTNEEADRLLLVLRKLNIVIRTAEPIEGVRCTGYKVNI